MKKLVAASLGMAALAMMAAGFFAYRAFHPNRVTSRETEAPVEDAGPQPEAGPIPIPETVITLKHTLQMANAPGDAPFVLEAGTELVSESTQGLDYIVIRDGRTFRVRCDDAFESHGRFTDGQAEQLALQLAAEIRAEGKVPTNERIASRAQDALEHQRLNPSFTDPTSLVENLQRVLLYRASASLDIEPSSEPAAKPD